jgi:hypothetical protein
VDATKHTPVLFPKGVDEGRAYEHRVYISLRLPRNIDNLYLLYLLYLLNLPNYLNLQRLLNHPILLYLYIPYIFHAWV